MMEEIPDQPALLNQISAHGFVLLENVFSHQAHTSIDELLLDQLSRFFNPKSYYAQPILMNVKPLPGSKPKSSTGIEAFPLHTDTSWSADPPMYMSMYCVHEGSLGSGVPLIADGLAAISSLSDSMLDELKNNLFEFKPPLESLGPGTISPIIRLSDNKLSIRFRRDMMFPANSEILDIFARHVEDYTKPLPQLRNSLIILDNRRMLHGRTAISRGFESDRHYIRVYGL